MVTALPSDPEGDFGGSVIRDLVPLFGEVDRKVIHFVVLKWMALVLDALRQLVEAQHTDLTREQAV